MSAWEATPRVSLTLLFCIATFRAHFLILQKACFFYYVSISLYISVLQHHCGIKMAEGKIPPEVKFPGASNWEQAMLLINGLKTLEYYLEQCFLSGRKEITILLSGKTGAGKSHLVNALIGQNLAKEGYTLDPETFEVSSEFEPEL